MILTSSLHCFSPEGEKYNKAKAWKIPTVSVQWLNDVLLSNVNAVQCMNNPKYHAFRPDDALRIDYSLVQNLILAWKNPIRVTPVSIEAHTCVYLSLSSCPAGKDCIVRIRDNPCCKLHFQQEYYTIFQSYCTRSFYIIISYKVN